MYKFIVCFFIIHRYMNDLRTYDENTTQFYFYEEMHKKQTFKFVKEKLQQYKSSYNTRLHMYQVLGQMDNFIDPSDPDTDEPNSFHAYQTAENIRRREPENTALQVCGLIHDLGKILFNFNEPSWAVVGDTYVVGCTFPETIVYYKTMLENPDTNNPDFSSKHGVYEPNCGIGNLSITVGHDEYLYTVLQRNNNHTFPEKYQDVIRFHSFYPWHTGGSYREFMKPGDDELLKDVNYFNTFDLYSKADKDFVVTDEIKHYFHDLLCDFFPEPLLW